MQINRLGLVIGFCGFENMGRRARDVMYAVSSVKGGMVLLGFWAVVCRFESVEPT